MVEVARSQIGIATYLAPDGSLADDSAVANLETMLESCIEANEIQVVIDFGNVSLVSSRLLDVLLEAQDRLTRMGGSLKIVHANSVVSDVMRITRLENYITLIDSELKTDEARGSRPVERGRLGEILLGSKNGGSRVELFILPSSNLVRMEGDEFAILFAHEDPVSVIQDGLEHMRCQNDSAGSNNEAIRLSIGMVSVAASFSPSQESVYKEADIALYVAKERKHVSPEALNVERRFFGESAEKVVGLETTCWRSSAP